MLSDAQLNHFNRNNPSLMSPFLDLSCAIGKLSACWRKSSQTKQTIVCVCRIKGKPRNIPVNISVLGDNSVSACKTSVAANGTDKIYNKHAKVLQPPSHVQLQRVGEFRQF